MYKILLIVSIGLGPHLCFPQATELTGSVKDAVSFQPLSGVTVSMENTDLKTLTDALGIFRISATLPLGEQFIKISKKGYVTKRFPIVIQEGETLNISDMTLNRDYQTNQDSFAITLTDDELDQADGGADNISGLLLASLDVFQRAAAFDFSQAFFSLRGMSSQNSKVLINGIGMNKLFNGKPQWSNWGGLNNVLRNQEFNSGLVPSDYNFGSVIGTTNINTRASDARPGGNLTYSSANRSYSNRLMASYASGLLENGWAYTIALGRRWGNSGFQEGTIYDANSFFISVERKLSTKQSLNFTWIYAPNKRGKAGPNTQEVYDLKGIKYNPYWGYQNGIKRNARIKTVDEPILMLNHNWEINSKTSLNTNVAYQFGRFSNSRLDYQGTDLVHGFPEGGGTNPSPTYYQKLPSYFERNDPENLGNAYLALETFLKDGQLDWNQLYEANIANTKLGGNAIYALYADVVSDRQFTFNGILNKTISEHVTLNSAINFTSLNSENYAEVIDLLGANTYLDIDGFAENINAAQNDLLHPNRLVHEGEKFKYHYQLNAQVLETFAKAELKYSKVDMYLSGQFGFTQYQRQGIYQNGAFSENSLGAGEKLKFPEFGLKLGGNYKLSGKHVLDANLGYISRAPTIQNSYTNPRENQNTVPNMTQEKVLASDLSYYFRSSILKARLTGYFISVKDANDIAFFFADGIGGDNTAFVQEILQGVNTKRLGLELGIEAKVTSTLSLKGVTSLGQYTYANNPNLYLTTEANQRAEEAGFIDGFNDFGKSYLKNYRLAAGPEQAYALGFEYRDPDYWFMGATANWLSHAYIDVSPLTRSSNFFTDFDGQVFNDYDENLAKSLLAQEQFKGYMLMNLIGGKSFKIGDKYISFFASINNLFDQKFKTGGFEQARNANYRQLRDDQALDKPVFGPKYWYGRGTTYFVNVSYRF
ncbi:carboxypeptidase regulatory-like domain-containing protein [Gaetbulibacter aestuarii]|uniref:Carboxypeptidase regulatory-like domain-containing protein n=1 Tax=Gaetbulibacter aestuarii TaxID=1502358 RepID=A0ABW7N0A8_9FLAO